MKPIEEGCLAIIINSIAGNNGICVTVGKFIGELPDYEYPDLWEVDKALKSIDGWGVTYEGDRMCAERQLLRVDGEEFAEDKELMEIKL